MNFALIARPSDMLAAQADARLSLLLADLRTGGIDSTGGLLAAASQLYADFYENLGAPLALPVAFAGMPIAEIWNRYQDRLTADLNVLYAQTRDISAATDRAVAYAQIENRMLGEAAKALQTKVASFQATRRTRLGLQRWTVSDTFADGRRVDAANSTGVAVLTASIELARTGQKNLTDQVELTLDDTYVAAVAGRSSTGSSNGFPGNLHEALVPENTNTLTGAQQSAIAQAVQLNAAPGQTIAFAGDGNLHADVAALTDGDPTTWFEYEVCNIPDAVRVNQARGYGFTLGVPQTDGSSPASIPWYAFHDDGVATTGFFPPLPTTSKLHPGTPQLVGGAFATASGATTVDPASGTSTLAGTATQTINLQNSGAPREGGVLRLVLNGKLKQTQTLTHVTITPNVLANKPPTVVGVQVRSADSAGWISATPVTTAQEQGLVSVESPASVNAGASTWTLPQTAVDYVRITIEQTQSYAATIGHLVWVEQDTINAAADPAMFDTLLGTSLHFEDPASAINYRRIDGPNPTLANVLSASRSSVVQTIEGIGSYLPGTAAGGSSSNSSILGPLIEAYSGWRYAIALRDITFESVGYVTTGILVTQDTAVPVDIKQISLSVDEYVPVGANIEYEVSLDAGHTWLPLAPQSHFASSSPRSYLVNPSSGSGVGILTTPNYDPVNAPAKSVRLRATLTRSGSDSGASPRLHGYTLLLEGNAS